MTWVAFSGGCRNAAPAALPAAHGYTCRRVTRVPGFPGRAVRRPRAVAQRLRPLAAAREALGGLERGTRAGNA
ncbi:hypothetical protein I6J71_20440 [Amycolatopsis sp. FDAARGOS 1241]|nr:hypothetical protein I6J71_20440 [Amycolatopsis sp. FDAARGOS 1241]